MSPIRVVTGVEDDRSMIVEQGPAPTVVTPAPGLEIAEQWRCERVGDGLLDAPDRSAEGFAPVPPPGGALFRLVSFAPDPNGAMHRTETVDFVAVISGQLVLSLDGGEEVALGPGDTVIQRGATHAWCNRTDETALAAVVMFTAER